MITKDNLINNPMNIGSHVVLLGAGTSRAAFPEGDANGKKLPLMKDFVEILNLSSLLLKFDIDIAENFEKIYSNIKEMNLKIELEKHIEGYFSMLMLPDTVTHYDRLLLSLREKDAIFTFNWDPFLFDAYMRNREIVTLPEIFFLHGNVRIGSCEMGHCGPGYGSCSHCNSPFYQVPLLYPVEQKNYFESNKYTAASWKSVMHFFEKAFTITIYGYSAPISDSEAVNIFDKAWFSGSKREAEHLEIIDIDKSSLERWYRFSPTHHFMSEDSFENSRLWRWPRRSCESLYYPMTQGKVCEDYPLPSNDDLIDLQNAIKNIAQFENNME